MSTQVISKGVLALQRSAQRPVEVTVDGEVFRFRKLTVSAEEEIRRLSDNYSMPELPKAPEGEGVTTEDSEAYVEQMKAYEAESTEKFCRLTCDLMKMVLVDENNKPFFEEGDDLYNLLNNIYMDQFYRAYNHFREGKNGSVTSAEARFQK